MKNFKFNVDYCKNNKVAIHVLTPEDVVKCDKILATESHSYLYKSLSNYGRLGSECIGASDRGHCDIDYYKKNSYEIVEARDFIKFNEVIAVECVDRTPDDTQSKIIKYLKNNGAKFDNGCLGNVRGWFYYFNHEDNEIRASKESYVIKDAYTILSSELDDDGNIKEKSSFIVGGSTHLRWAFLKEMNIADKGVGNTLKEEIILKDYFLLFDDGAISQANTERALHKYHLPKDWDMAAEAVKKFFESNTITKQFGEVKVEINGKVGKSEFGEFTKVEIENLLNWIGNAPKWLSYTINFEDKIKIGCQSGKISELKEIYNAMS